MYKEEKQLNLHPCIMQAMMTQGNLRVSFWVVNPLDIIKEEWHHHCQNALRRPWGVHIFHLSLFSSFRLEAADGGMK